MKVLARIFQKLFVWVDLPSEISGTIFEICAEANKCLNNCLKQKISPEYFMVKTSVKQILDIMQTQILLNHQLLQEMGSGKVSKQQASTYFKTKILVILGTF